MQDAWEDWFQKDERLLWQGAPASGQWNWIRNAFMTAFGIPFLGAGLFVSGMGLGHLFSLGGIWDFGLGIFLTAFGIPFLAVGGGLVFGTWLHDYMTPTHTRFALTNRAGYIATRYWKRNMDVVPITSDTQVEIQESRKGLASIYFGFDQYTDRDGDRQTRQKGFEGIIDGAAVYRLIRAIKAGEEVTPI